MHNKHIIESIHQWHKLARPNPDDKAFQVQLGCHFEEIAEMIETISLKSDGWSPIEGKNCAAFLAIKELADALKNNEAIASITNRKGFIDSIADQVVTGIGAAYCAGMKPVLALERVDTSNWSKFVEDRPVFNEQGKIAKPLTYQKPNLKGCY